MIITFRARVLSDAGLYAALFLFLAGQTAAGSAQHAHDAFVQGGQGNPAWLPWTLAGTPELLAILATLEYRHRRKVHGVDVDVRVPVAIIVGSALVLMGAQLVTAQHSTLGMFAAAWPALAFLVALALVETRPRAAAVVKPARVPRQKTERSTQETEQPTPERILVTEDPDPATLKIPAALAPRVDALTVEQRAVWDVLAEHPGKLHGIGEICGRLGWDRHKTRRALLPMLSGDAPLVLAGDRPGQYAARAWVEAVA